MIDSLKKEATARMAKSVDSLKQELTKLRTGRAHASLLDHITVSYYGNETPLNQVASVAVADARTAVAELSDLVRGSVTIGTVTAHDVDMPSLLARFASSAARVFGLDGRKGALGVGLDADAVLIDPGRAWTITAHSLRYLNPFSAFEGLEGVGLPVCTVVRGRVVAREGNVLAPFGHGLFQPRKP